MPIQPHPFTTTCQHCGWKHTSVPASDALKMNVDVFCSCPACQHTELEVRSASRTEIMRERLSQFFL